MLTVRRFVFSEGVIACLGFSYACLMRRFTRIFRLQGSICAMSCMRLNKPNRMLHFRFLANDVLRYW